MRILKVGETIYENFNLEFIPLESEEELREAVKDTLLWLARRKISQVFEKNGYYSVGDLKLHAERGEEEAQNLLDWYVRFDNRLWDWIENELPQKSSEELSQIDLYSLVEGFSND